jgi:N-acyl-phosphatidylethanolamine-hydrolysing phospholipase D
MVPINITYLGHASTIIQIAGVTIYTDPHFGVKALCVKRSEPLPFKPEELPPPDLILISHAHYDHLDLHSFKYFHSKVPVIVPRGVGRFLGRYVRNPVIELVKGSEYVFDKGVTIHAVPVKHKGGRLSGLRYRKALGYVVESEAGNIFFAGDTAYTKDLLKARQLGPLKLALLPIAPCKPRFFMKRYHMDPAQALRIFEELGAKHMVPIHWGVFRLGLDRVEESIEILAGLLAKSGLKDSIHILKAGQNLSL